MSFLLEPVFWNWYLLGVVLVVIELLLPGVYVVWFGIGALVCGLLFQVIGDIYWPYQIIAFCTFSSLSLFLGRRFIKQAAPSKTSTLNRRLYQYIGRRGTLETPIVNGKGRVKLDDTYWTVTGADLPANTAVTITGVENSRFVVQESDPGAPPPDAP